MCLAKPFEKHLIYLHKMAIFKKFVAKVQSFLVVINSIFLFQESLVLKSWQQI